MFFFASERPKVSPTYSRKNNVTALTLADISALRDRLIAASVSRGRWGRSTFGASKKSVRVSKMV